MLPLVVTLIVIAALTVLMGRYSFRQPKPQPAPRRDDCTDCADCSIVSSGSVCRVADATSDIVYFDDEELDRFAHRAPDDYSDDEVDEFADILHTMRTEEVSQWLQSLTQRGINPPEQLKEEIVMFLND